MQKFFQTGPYASTVEEFEWVGFFKFRKESRHAIYTILSWFLVIHVYVCILLSTVSSKHCFLPLLPSFFFLKQLTVSIFLISNGPEKIIQSNWRRTTVRILKMRVVIFLLAHSRSRRLEPILPYQGRGWFCFRPSPQLPFLFFISFLFLSNTLSNYHTLK